MLLKLTCTILILFTSSIYANTRSVIYDTDLAMDDWFGLLYLIKSGEMELRGVTVVGSGEANCQFADRVVGELLSIAGEHDDYQSAVHCGSLEPLDGYFAFPTDWRKGANTLNGWLPMSDDEYERTLRKPYDGSRASRFIIHELEKNDHLEIIAVGPLSNIAQVILDRPDLVNRISKLWIMGANFRTQGNIGSNPYPSIRHLQNNTSEWNIWTDIEAAKIVFDSAIPTYLVPLDATNSVPITEQFVEDYRAAVNSNQSPVGDFILSNYDLPFVKEWLKQDRFYFWDTLAVGIALDESMCEDWIEASVTVNTQMTEYNFVYTDQRKPDFSETNVYGEPRKHYHPLIAGALIENPYVPKSKICVAANRERFYKDFLRATVFTQIHR